MPHPNFFGFGSRPGRVCPGDARRPPVLRPDHAPATVPFPSVPCLGFEHDSDRFAASLSKRCQPAPERGRGGFRMGRTQPPKIAKHHGTAPPSFFGVHPVYLLHTSSAAPAKSGPASSRRPAHGPKGFAGPFYTKLWRQHDFSGTFLTFGSRILWLGRAVWIGVRPCDRPGPGRRGAQRVVGGLGCSLMLAAFLAP